jgi:hypothetical protein
MKAESILTYYSFGTCVRCVEDVSDGYPIHNIEERRFALANLKRVLEYVDTLDLKVSARAAFKLRKIESELDAKEKDALLNAETPKRLSDEVTSFRSTLEAELSGLEAYVIGPKRIDVRRLMDDVPSLFAPGVFTQLDDVAKVDLSEAGKCIAFERSTAAAFHLLRGTESVLRNLYIRNAKRNRVSLMWGPMVQDLKNRKALKADESLINNLDDIRLHFRNPTQHPEKTYDIEEAQDLWGRCVDAINRMAKYLK